jgi:hypothetical protein
MEGLVATLYKQNQHGLLLRLVRQIVVHHIKRISFFLAEGSSVWDCMLLRRPAKDARRRHESSSAGYKQKRLVVRKWLSNLRCHRITMV